jgi:hypothetical protein
MLRWEPPGASVAGREKGGNKAMYFAVFPMASSGALQHRRNPD